MKNLKPPTRSTGIYTAAAGKAAGRLTKEPTRAGRTVPQHPASGPGSLTDSPPAFAGREQLAVEGPTVEDTDPSHIRKCVTARLKCIEPKL